MRSLPARFRKIDLTDLEAASSAEHRDVITELEASAPQAVLPTLEYTEGRREWIALYRHCERGQISPKVLRRMRDVDLEYLAGAPTPADLYRHYGYESGTHPEAAELIASKLQANVIRATRELQRRYSRNLAWSIAALSGSIAILSAIVGLLASG